MIRVGVFRMGIEEIKIFIPTKGRCNNQKTYQILCDLGLSPILVCEPQEKDLLKNFNKIVLPENNKGISYSRNYILEYSRAKNFDYIIQIDDDINCFYKNEDGKQIKDNKAFLVALEIFYKNKCYCGLEYCQYAWCAKTPYTFNRSIEVCLMMYLPSIPNYIRFDENAKEDKDFAIQILLAGYPTLKINWISLSVPSIGTNKGGLHDWYANKKDIQASYYMLDKWGTDLITLKQKKNTIDAMVNWKNIAKLREV